MATTAAKTPTTYEIGDRVTLFGRVLTVISTERVDWEATRAADRTVYDVKASDGSRSYQRDVYFVPHKNRWSVRWARV